MKIILNQLSLFDAVQEDIKDLDDILTEKANLLLDALNDGLKKNLWECHSWKQFNDVVLLVANKGTDFVFNVLDLNGKTPKGFCVNWRNAQLVKDELYKYLKTNQTA